MDLAPRLTGDETSEQAQQQAKALNTEGLRAHNRRRYDESRQKFERAAELDPNFGHARFNAACAAARLGDTDGARAHIDAFLRLEPGSAGRVMHDEDLIPLRNSDGFVDWLTSRVRTEGGLVRSLVFERRQNGGDLFTVAEDGLDEQPLAADPDWREYQASVTGDGRTVVYLASEFGRAVPARQMGKGHPQRDWSDLAQQGRLYSWRWDHELRAQPAAGGTHRVLATRVMSYRLVEDGTRVLFMDEPTERSFRIRSAPLEGGEPTTLAELGPADTWCYVLRGDGSLLVAEGMAHSWANALSVRVVEYRDRQRTELLAPRDLRVNDPRVPDFTLCDLATDESDLHLGLIRISLGDSPQLSYLTELSIGDGAYNFRHVGARSTADHASGELFLTVVGSIHSDGEEYEGPPYQYWQTSPLGWENNNGMGPPWWYETRIVRTDRAGAERHSLSPERGSFEYGPALRPDRRVVAFTRHRLRGQPWIIISDRDGGARRRVAPGQYPVWIP